MMTSARRLKNPVLLVCDLQEKFRPAIHHFTSVLSTTSKLLRASKALQIPIVVTTQQRAKLGETCTELGLGTSYTPSVDVDKAAFSMWVPALTSALKKLPQREVDVDKDTSMKREPFDIILVGIETHICVLQTTLDALSEGHRVWIVQDAVSSCNAEERAIALARLRQEGARVTTSESLLYEVMGDSSDPAFREVVGIVKDTKEQTKSALSALASL